MNDENKENIQNIPNRKYSNRFHFRAQSNWLKKRTENKILLRFSLCTKIIIFNRKIPKCDQIFSSFSIWNILTINWCIFVLLEYFQIFVWLKMECIEYGENALYCHWELRETAYTIDADCLSMLWIFVMSIHFYLFYTMFIPKHCSSPLFSPFWRTIFKNSNDSSDFNITDGMEMFPYANTCRHNIWLQLNKLHEILIVWVICCVFFYIIFGRKKDILLQTKSKYLYRFFSINWNIL